MAPPARMLGIYSGAGDSGELCEETFGRYPDCLSQYYQHGAVNTLTTRTNLMISRNITPFVTISFKDYLDAAGSSTVIGKRPNAYSIVAAGRAASPAAYDAVIALIDGWARALQAIAVATATTSKGIVLYACLDSEPDAKTNADNPNGLVINATMTEIGKFFDVGSARFRLLAPNVKYGVWFAQSRKPQIIECLAAMSVGSLDWMSADPYTNGRVSSTATVETWEACVSSKWTQWIRSDNTNGVNQWIRHGSPPLAVTEFGISNGDLWDYGVGTRDHTDAQIATYYTNLRTKMALANVDVFAALLFDADRDRDHRITGPAAPLTPLGVTAFKNSLNASGTVGPAATGVTAIGSATTTVGDMDSADAAPTFYTISGLVVSKNPNGDRIFWGLNDNGAASAGGGDPAIHAFSDASSTRRILASYTLGGTFNGAGGDWEDLAWGPGPSAGVRYLYIGNFGAQGASDTDLRIYRVAEPVVTSGQTKVTATIAAANIDTFRFTRPTGTADCEAFICDPRTGDLYYFEKKSGQTTRPLYSRVYRIPASQLGALTAAERTTGYRQVTLTEVASILASTTDQTNDATLTAADITEDGDAIAVTTYQGIWIYNRGPTQTVTQAFGGTPVYRVMASGWGPEAMCFDRGSQPKRLYGNTEGTTTVLRFLGVTWAASNASSRAAALSGSGSLVAVGAAGSRVPRFTGAGSLAATGQARLVDQVPDPGYEGGIPVMVDLAYDGTFVPGFITHVKVREPDVLAQVGGAYLQGGGGPADPDDPDPGPFAYPPLGAYNGGPDGDDDATTRFGAQSQISSTYYSSSQPGLNVVKEKDRIDKGIIPHITLSAQSRDQERNYYADIVNNSNPAAVAWMQEYVDALAAIGAYGLEKGVPVYAAIESEIDTDLKRNSLALASAQAASMTNFGQLWSIWGDKVYDETDGVTPILWVAGNSDKWTDVNTILSAMTVYPGAISVDPYANAPGEVAPVDNWAARLNAFRGTTGVLRNQWVRVGSPPIGLGEFGMSKWRPRAAAIGHTDPELERFYKRVREDTVTSDLAYAIMFNRNSGGNGTHSLTVDDGFTGDHPLGRAALGGQIALTHRPVAV